MSGANEPAQRCPGCDVVLPAVDGPVHRYMESSPACWAAYGDVLAREYSDPAYLAVHRLTVDAFAVQHPGRPSPQSIQSVGAHLVALHAVLDRGASYAAATRLLGRCVERLRFTWLDPPARRGEIVAADVLRARDAAEHAASVERWAADAWRAWELHHPQVRAWAEQAWEE